jgi:hypothetical protein
MLKASQSTIKKDAYRPYLVIAFGITWLLWGISLALNQSRGYLIPAPQVLMRRALAFPALIEAQLHAPKGSFDFLLP